MSSKSDKNKITLSLKNDKKNYRPGEKLKGEVQWEFADNAPEIKIQVYWYTGGLGEPEMETVDTESIPAPMKSGSQQFEFELPVAPYSYQGPACNLSWGVRAAAFKGKTQAACEFSMAPTGNPLFLTICKNAAKASPGFHLKKKTKNRFQQSDLKI